VQHDLDITNQILIFAMFGISLNILMGYAGQVSVASAALGGVGGYMAGWLSALHGVGFIPSLLAGVGAALVLGTLVSIPALRLTTDYLILLTFAFATVVVSAIAAIPALGGAYGLLGIHNPQFLGLNFLYPRDYFWMFLVLTVAVLLVCWRIGDSPFGRVLKGIREDEHATRALGKNVFSYKVAAFAITSAIAGLAGALLVFYNQLATTSVFDFNALTTIMAIVVIGGMGNLLGSILGAALVILLEPLLESWLNMSPDKAALWRLVIYGLALVVVVRLRPAGLLPEGLSLRRLVRRARTPAAPPRTHAVPAAVNGDGKLPSQALQVRGLSKHFGGIRAVQGVDLDVESGTITGLVGPNGAGKTTIFNLLTGALPADAGTVHLFGDDVTGLQPHEVARRGMVRTFQDVRVFARLSVLENVMLAVQGQPGERLRELFLLPWRPVRGERVTRERALEALTFVNLTEKAYQPAGALGYGDQKLVVLARALATGAQILLLDEPASGIDRSALEPILAVIEELRSSGRTILLVEHNLDVVDRLADTVYFMEQARVTAQGPMAEIRSQERLAEVYFGHV
jgi:branched-chain amino acid transport system ATP-binding protein/branched-chain amino acid transport system permease protein